MHNLITFLTENRWLVAGISIGSILLLLMTVLMTPWLLSRLPADYFCRDQQSTQGAGIRQQLKHGLLNILGFIVLLLGITMMFTPGPGLVVMLAGLSLIRLPAKQRLIKGIASRPGIFHSMNKLRERSRQPPFIHPVMEKGSSHDSAS